jgi:hypothetical protein
MNNPLGIASWVLACFCISCSLSDYSIDFPVDVPFGTTLVYINGELREFENNSYFFKSMDSTERLTITFGEKINGSEFNHQIAGTTYFPTPNSNLNIVDEKTDNPSYINVFFSQTYDEDSDGWEYKYCGTKDDFFRLDIYDPGQHIISGEAQLKFKRVKKNNVPDDAGLEKTLLIELKFYDYYEVK